MYKRILILLALVAMTSPVFAVNPTADSEDVGKDQMGLQKSDGSFAVRITSSGHIVGGTDRSIDLGSPAKRMRNIYTASSTVQSGALLISTDSTFNYGTPNQYASSASLTIPYTGTFMILTSTEGPIRMTATPEISTANAHDGDMLIILSATASVILQDRLSILNTGLALGAATRTLGYLDNIQFIFNASTGAWVERGFANVQ